jgi:hypothetical protein
MRKRRNETDVEWSKRLDELTSAREIERGRAELRKHEAELQTKRTEARDALGLLRSPQTEGLFVELDARHRGHEHFLSRAQAILIAAQANEESQTAAPPTRHEESQTVAPQPDNPKTPGMEIGWTSSSAKPDSHGIASTKRLASRLGGSMNWLSTGSLQRIIAASCANSFPRNYADR